jgi:hypothetical protein
MAVAIRGMPEDLGHDVQGQAELVPSRCRPHMPQQVRAHLERMTIQVAELQAIHEEAD